jgi:hypothetical protein
MNTAIWIENKPRRKNLTLSHDQMMESYEKVIHSLMQRIEELEKSEDRVFLNQR